MRVEESDRNLGDFKRELIHRHLSLGKCRPISYLPIKAIVNLIGIDVSKYEEMAKSQGYLCRIYNKGETCIDSGAVYAYCELSLSIILENNRQTLLSNGWGAKCNEFVDKIAQNWLQENDPLISVVRAVFGDN